MGGGPESQINTWNLFRKISHVFKKTKCSKQPKKQNKPNFYFSLSGVPNVRGGWVGSDVSDKVPKKTFFLTPSLTDTNFFSKFLQRSKYLKPLNFSLQSLLMLTLNTKRSYLEPERPRSACLLGHQLHS